MRNLSKAAALSIIVFLLTYSGCKNDGEEATQSTVDTTTLVVQYYDTGNFTTDEAASNQMVLNALKGLQNQRNRFINNTIDTAGFDALETSKYFNIKAFTVEGGPDDLVPVPTRTNDLIKELFNRTGAACLPGVQGEKFRHMAKNKVPEQQLFLHTRDSVMNYYEQIPGIVILSTFQVKKPDGSIRYYTVPSGRVGVASVLDLLNPNDASSYVYQIDCSGYFTFALSIGAKVPGIADMNSAGNFAGKSKKSSIIAYGKFTSPIAMALKPNFFNMKFDNATQKQVLQSILAADAFANGDVVIANNYAYLLLTSLLGESGFNGKVDLNATTGGSIGVISASAQTTAGAIYSKSVKFTDYNTYVSTRLLTGSTNETRMTVAEIKAAISAL